MIVFLIFFSWKDTTKTPSSVTVSQYHSYLKWGYECEEKFLVIYITKSILWDILWFYLTLKQLWFCDTVTLHGEFWRFKSNIFVLDGECLNVLYIGNKNLFSGEKISHFTCKSDFDFVSLYPYSGRHDTACGVPTKTQKTQNNQLLTLKHSLKHGKISNLLSCSPS